MKQFCGLHAITHKFKHDLLDDFSCRYLILIPVQYVCDFYQKIGFSFFSNTANNEKKHNIKTMCIHQQCFCPCNIEAESVGADILW